MKNFFSVFYIFLKLGLTAFGGPVAHLAYFREEFVNKRKWLTEQSYADLVALCQFLPGPASSQVGMALGMHKAGFTGLFAAWIGFTLPSAILLIFFALGLANYSSILNNGVLNGLKIVALVVVIQAVWGMGRNLCPDRPRITIMTFAACAVLLFPSVGVQIIAILVAGLIGTYLFKEHNSDSSTSLSISVSRKLALLFLLLFFGFLLVLPFLSQWYDLKAITLIDIFYRAGSLVFGGGHVVLPLLQSEVVSNFLDNQTFLAGYGATQAVPGPLFTFSAFLGAAIPDQDLIETVSFGFLCLIMIFLPSFFMVVGVLPFWQTIQQNDKVKSALLGVNAAVVGILLATLFNPIWMSSIKSTNDFVFALIVFVVLFFWKLPIWMIVLAGALMGGVIGI